VEILHSPDYTHILGIFQEKKQNFVLSILRKYFILFNILGWGLNISIILSTKESFAQKS